MKLDFLNGHCFLEKNNRGSNVLSRTFLKICFQARIVDGRDRIILFWQENLIDVWRNKLKSMAS